MLEDTDMKRIVLLVDKGFQGLFALRTTLQLQKHVLHGERVGDFAAVVQRSGFTAGVAGERVKAAWIDGPGYQNAGRWRDRGNLRRKTDRKRKG